jgi:pilus assembly protein CpaB
VPAGSAQDIAHLLEPGLRAIAVHVDQATGVGTLINVGDRVDIVVGLTGDKVPLVTRDATTGALATISGYNPTTTKVILQNMQVIGTLTPAGAGSSNPQPSGGATAGQPEEELVILAVTAQQAEVIKFAQMDGQITLVLRSPKDFVDANGQPVTPPDAATSGIVLKTLIDQYGVLPPQLIPAQTPLP